jgi:hypothetical protein
LIVAPWAVGCHGPQELDSPPEAPAFAAHDPHAPAPFALPADFIAALPWIGERIAAVQGAVQTGRPHDAHEPLDELAVVLFRLPYLARDSGVPRRDWETINTSARALRFALDQIHERIDGEQPVDPLLSGAALEQPLARLRAVAAAADGALSPDASPQVPR